MTKQYRMLKQIKTICRTLVLPIFLWGVSVMPNAVYAQSASETADPAQIQVQAIKDNLTDYKTKVCNAPKDKNGYDADVLQVAYTLSDAYEKTFAATSNSPWATLADSSLSQAYGCAQEYIAHVASVKKRQADPGESVAERIIAAAGDCWPCNIAFLMIDSIQVMASVVYESVTEFALILLGVMLMFWLAFRVLILIGKFGYSSNSEFFTDLLYRFIAVTVAAVLLSTPILEFYRIAVSPLIGITASLATKFTEYSLADEGGRTFSQQVMEKLKEQKAREGSCDTNLLQKMKDKESLSGYDETTKRNCCVLSLDGEWTPTRTVESCMYYGALRMCQNTVLPEECKFNSLALSGTAATKEGFTCSYCADAMNPEATLPHTSAFTPVLDDQTINALLCLTCTVYKQFAPLIESGSSIFGYVISNWKGFLIFKLPRPFMGLILGPLLMVLFTMLSFVVAFRVIDVFLRFGFVIILTPLLITAWAFPISRQYAKKGWDFIIGNLLEFLGIAVAGALLLNLCLALLPDSAMKELIPAMAGTDVEALYDAFTGDIPGGSLHTMMILIGVFFIGLKLLETTQKLVESISGITLGIPPMSQGAAMKMLNTAGNAASVAGKYSGATDALKNVSRAVSEGGAAALGSFMGGASLTQSIRAGHAAGMSRVRQAGKSITGSAMASHLKSIGKGVAGVAKGAKSLTGKGGLKAFGESLKNLPKDLKDGAKVAITNYARGRVAAVGHMMDRVAGATHGAGQNLKKHLGNISNLMKNPKLAMQVAGKYAADKAIAHAGSALAKLTGSSSDSPIEMLKNAAAGAGVIARATLRHPGKTMKRMGKKALGAAADVAGRVANAAKHPLATGGKALNAWKQTVQKIDAVTGNGFKAQSAAERVRQAESMKHRAEVAKRLGMAKKMRPDPNKKSKYDA